MLEISAATRADVPTILGFIRELAEYEKLLPEVSATETLLERYLFDEAKCRALIARWDGVAVGYALYFYNFSTFLARPGIYLEDLYVQPAHRNRKIGRALLGHLANIAVAENCGRLEWSVLDWNAPSIAFYKSLGAQPMDEWDDDARHRRGHRESGAFLTLRASLRPNFADDLPQRLRIVPKLFGAVIAHKFEQRETVFRFRRRVARGLQVLAPLSRRRFAAAFFRVRLAPSH